VNSRESRSHYSHVENEYKQSATGRPPRGEYESVDSANDPRDQFTRVYIETNSIASYRHDPARRRDSARENARSQERAALHVVARLAEEGGERGGGEEEGGREGGREKRARLLRRRINHSLSNCRLVEC